MRAVCFLSGPFSAALRQRGGSRAAFILVCFLLIMTPGPRPGVIFAQNASALGYTGLMLVPVADIARDGEITAGISRIPVLYADWWPNRRTVFWGRIGFLPFLEAGGMFVRPDHYTWGFGDRTVFLKLQLMREHGDWPSLCIGAQDFFAIEALKWETATAQHFGALYLVTSRHVAIKGVPLHLHLGYGPDWLVAQTSMLAGWFGGVSYSPHRRVALIAEYDARSVNAGVRLMPFSFMQLQWAWWRMDEVAATLAVSVALE